MLTVVWLEVLKVLSLYFLTKSWSMKFWEAPESMRICAGLPAIVPWYLIRVSLACILVVVDDAAVNSSSVGHSSSEVYSSSGREGQ